MAETVRAAGVTAATALVPVLVVDKPSPFMKLLPPSVATKDAWASTVEARAVATSPGDTPTHAYVSAYCTARDGGKRGGET